MIAEAETAGRWFQPLAAPELGAVIVYPSVELERDGARARASHLGIISAVPASWLDREWTALRVIHCSASLQRRLGHAIDETHAVAWARRATFRGATHPRWRTRFLRYTAAVPGDTDERGASG
jgi:hypothetical protein